MQKLFGLLFIKINHLIRSGHSLLSHPGPKYKKTSFTNPGHAYHLAKKLNLLFETNHFSVKKIVDFTND